VTGTAHLGERVTALQATYPGVPVEWRPATRADLPALLAAGRTATLLVVGRTSPAGGPDPRLDVVVDRSAAPVLVVPLDAPTPRSPSTVRALISTGGRS
jgi:hypothetical protein